MKKVFILFISLLTLTACSSQSTKPNSKKQNQNNTSDTEKVNGYVYHDSKNALFLQFTNNNGNLNGSFYERLEDSNNQFQSHDSPITGQIDGNNISVTIKASGNTYSGNFSSGEIDLGIPQQNGTVANFAFKSGTLTDFNNYVADIQTSTSKDQQAAQQAQQTADSNKQLSELEDKINTEMQTIQKSDAQSLQTDVQGTGTDINGEKKDLASVNQDYQTAISSGDVADANQVNADANQIQADDNQIQSDNNQFQNDVQQFQGNLSSFQNDVQSMNSLASQLGQTLPEYLPKKSDVDSIVNKANSIIKSTTVSMNSYVASSKQMLNSANSLSDKAQKHAGN